MKFNTFTTKKNIGKAVALTLALTATTQLALAQEETVDETALQNRAELTSLRVEQRAELEALRLEQVREENPELAAEMEAFKAERETLRAERDTEFREKYPLLAAQRDEAKANRESLKHGSRGGQRKGFKGESYRGRR